MIKAGVNATGPNWRRVFYADVRGAFRRYLDFDEACIPEEEDPAAVRRDIEGARVILSTWGAVPLDGGLLDSCPDLELILHAAGTVKSFMTEELKRREIIIVSSAWINAISVAEYTLGLILTSLRNVFQHKEDFLRDGRAAWNIDRENYDGGYYRSRVGIIGDGHVVRHLLEHLKRFSFEVLVDSEYFTAEDESRFGARRADLKEVLSTCDVVSLHHADVPRWWNLLNRETLALMKKGARLINTSRGRLIDEDALIERLVKGDLTAYLDVTNTEPPEEGHPFYRLPNCILTPHIAGSIGREVRRMSEFCLEQLTNWLNGRRLEGLVDIDKIDIRA